MNIEKNQNIETTRADELKNKWYWNQFEKLTLLDYLNIKYALYLRKCEDLNVPIQPMDDWLKETENSKDINKVI